MHKFLITLVLKSTQYWLAVDLYLFRFSVVLLLP